MATEVVMPRLGWTMEVGRVVEWLKGDGDPVESGDLILAIESDKAISEIEALDSGILRIPADPQIGVELPVGAPLGFILQPGDPDPFAGGAATVATAAPATIRADPVAVSQPYNGGSETRAISPRARRIAIELGVEWSGLSGSGAGGRIREADIRAVLATKPAQFQPRATPSVRRLADESGIDLAAVQPTRPGGRVSRADVLALKDQPGGEPITPVRRVIIQRMTESARTVAPVTLTTDADATELVDIRAQLKADAGPGDAAPTYHDLIARLVALALVRHPALNATLLEDRIVQHTVIHLGIAVDTERGLMVPVVRDAGRKSVHEIAEESARLIEATRAGSVSPDDLQGSTFTISNLGMYDIDAFTPIINLPECAILGLGRIQARAVVIDEDSGEIAARKMMALSLTFDHRVVDGAPAARFLQAVKQMIERPLGQLMR